MTRKIYLSDVCELTQEYKENGLHCFENVYDFEFDFYIDKDGEHGNRIIYNQFLQAMAERIEVKYMANDGALVDIATFVNDNLDKIEEIFETILGEKLAVEYIVEMIKGEAETCFYENFVNEFPIIQNIKEKYKIKLPKHIFTKLREIQKVYFENKKEYGNGEDSFTYETLEEELHELLNDPNVKDIWNVNIEITKHFDIDEKLTIRQKTIKLYNRLFEDFEETIENVDKVYEEIITEKDINMEEGINI